MTKGFWNRFWKKVNVRSSSECWPWQGPTDRDGYGILRIDQYFNDSARAHRLAYQWTNGNFNSDLIIRHSCDNPSCCNPNHLISGTQTDNMQDKIKRGRSNTTRGIDHPHSKLNEETVKVIKWMLKYNNHRGIQMKLSKMYGVSPSTIAYIRSGRNWKHIKV